MSIDDSIEKLGGAAIALLLSPVTILVQASLWLWTWWNTPSPPQIDWDQVRNEEQEREKRKANVKTKCDELRLECELAYNRHAEQFSNSLPPEQFTALLNSYISGNDDPQLVRKRTRMIKAMFDDRVSSSQPADKARFESLRELAEHFAAYRQEVEELPYDDDTKDSFLTALNEHETKAMERFFEKGVA